MRLSKGKLLRFRANYDDDKILKGKHLKCTDSIVDNVRKSLIEELEIRKENWNFICNNVYPSSQ